MGDQSADRHPTAPTPRASSNVLPNISTHDNSPESNPKPTSQPSPPDSNSSPSPTSPSPTSPAGTGPSARPGHGRIASTSTSNSRPEGYPSWLPRRPPPPEPASTVGFGTRPSTRAGFDSPDSLGGGEIDWELVTGAPEPHYIGEQVPMPADEDAGPSSSVPANARRHTHTGLPTAGPSSPRAPKGERKPTPRSVRIVSVPGVGPALVGDAATGSREASDSTRVPSGGFRAYSRATGASALSPTLISSLPSRGGPAGRSSQLASHGKGARMKRSIPPSALYPTPVPFFPPAPVRPPRFRTPKFHPTLLKDPSRTTRARWWAWWFAVIFGHIILQTFLDFNIAYMMIQVARHPTPSPLGMSSSTHNWTFATVGYIACWAIWLVGIVLLYEAVYCFWRRWRVKRPLLIPIYLSAPAYNLVCLTSYTNFCFLQHIRWSAISQYGAVADGDSSVSSARRKVEKEATGDGEDEWEEVRRSEGDEPETPADVKRNPDDQPTDSNGSDPISYVAQSTDSPAPVPAPSKHNRQISQAQTQSSARSKNRTSGGFESSADGPGSEGKPPISELASSVRSLGTPAPASPAGDGDEIQQQQQSTFPAPLRPGPRGVDGSAFFEHRGTYAASLASVSSSASSTGSSRPGRDVLQFIAESCWFYSQNLPTMVLLIPRLALTLALYMAFVGPSTGVSLGLSNGLGRDGTFFGSKGELSVYSKVIIWIQIAWGLWRAVVLLGSWVGLWILSGSGCAGFCGPRYRWEESYDRDDDPPLPYIRPHEKRLSERAASKQPEIRGSTRGPASSRLSAYTVDDSRFNDRDGRRAFSDPDDHTLNWSWMERCRDRIWDTWEFCLTRSTKSAEAQDAYWSAWRSAVGGGGTGNGHGADGQMAERPKDADRLTVSFGAAGPTPTSAFNRMSQGLSSSTTAAGTPIPFIPASMVNFQHQGYGQLDTILSTLPEMSSNPSLAASAAPASSSPGRHHAPSAIPSPPLPIFSAQPPRRGVLSQDLFAGPVTTTSAMDDGAWLGSSAVPLSGPAAVPYPFPAYSSENPPQTAQMPKAPLPFPLVPVSQNQSQTNRNQQTIFPTPATTVLSLPFPIPQSLVALGSPQQHGDAPLSDYQDEENFSGAEHGVLPAEHSRAQSHSGTGSMSSLGQPIQTRYPFGYRRARGRHSSASGSASGPASSVGPRESDASMSGSGNGIPHHRSPRASIVSGSTSGYGSHAVIRNQASRSTRLSVVSNGYGEGGGDVYVYVGEDEAAGDVSDISSQREPGMAGVGAGGGMGPRASLVNLAIPPSSPESMARYQPTAQNIAPPPRHPHGRRRAGTLPSPSSSSHAPPPLPVVPFSLMSRTRVSSVPSPTSREFGQPLVGYDADMPAFAQAHGFDDYDDDDDDDEPEGSQEAAEREDSVGLLSQAPSRRSSFSGMNIRARASSISLHRRGGNNSRPVSITGASQNSAAAGVRSSAASVVRSPPASASASRESLNSSFRGSLALPEPRARTDSLSGAARSERVGSQYSDARTHSDSGSGGHGPRGGGNDLTFGVQVDWTMDDHSAAPQSEEPISPRTVLDPSTIRQRRSDPSVMATGTQDIDLRSRHSAAGLAVPYTSRTPALNIPVVPGMSRQDLSSADASFVTARPTLGTDSDTHGGHSEGGGSSDGIWGRERAPRHFVEGGPGMWGPR